MSKYADIKARFEMFDPADYKTIFGAKTETLAYMFPSFPMLHLVLAGFINKTIAADGVIADSEVQNILSICPIKDEKVVKEKASKFLSEDYKIDGLIQYYKSYPEFLRDEIILVCMIEGAIDGNFDEKEEAWLKTLC